MDAAQDFQTGENIQAAVEPAAVWDGIHVAADEQTLLRLPLQSHRWETLVPIPNTAVKPFSPDDTWGATPRENRPLPLHPPA